jgi:flagellar biosynthesis protein FlhB
VAELRPFPPSPRRRALARGAGLHAASPLLVGALACGAVLLAIAMLGAAAVARLGTWLAAATRGEATLGAGDLPRAVLELAAPLLGVAAIVAIGAHLAQTRAVWLPRRRVEGAPAVQHGDARALVAPFVIGAIAFGWLWLVAPRLAALTAVPLAGALLVTSAAATFAIAWVVLGVGDALLRHRELASALFMTAREKREDERLASGDPRWRAERTRAQRVPELAGATLLVLGDGVAAAIAWDPVRRPVPIAIAHGRGARATQLLALARRHGVPVHREHALADKLEQGAIDDRHWPRLAEIVAAIRQ